MRPFLIAGNWKMHMNAAETRAYFETFKGLVSAAPNGVSMLLCPTFTSLTAAAEASAAITGMHIGAQNLHFEDKGAFTGEITAEMIKETGADHVIIGHSERRQYYNETDETVNKKTQKALSAGLTPVVCVGEFLEERKKGIHFEVVKKQMVAGYEGISAGDAKKTVLAYEPVWAIGTGETASPEQAQEMHAFIRAEFTALYGADVAAKIPLLYGGSMNAANADELLSQEDVDGGLIGGASLKPDSFQQIVGFAGEIFAKNG
ncbi:MAG: triose-phosphate isomerase [Candidatus Cyclonatronum sp.]|uniref:triose-phosphate isomerase n=1 Tax=Cyclonatronum sp. TaxID=3024185 RepID=UPI0025BF29C9|nr:triose-phosphate isomerase [Cyclonatronum sp.]MCH8485663.1 triose-phosphate isomerase [Cyclonatronum sp.]